MMSISEAREVILKRGDVLLVLPVMAQFALLFIMTLAVSSITDEVNECLRSRAILYQSNNLERLFHDAGVSVGDYALTRSPTFADRFTTIAREIPEDLSELRKQVGDDPVKQEQLNSISSLMTKGLGLLSDRKRAIDDSRADTSPSKAKQAHKEIGLLNQQIESKFTSMTVDYRQVDPTDSALGLSSVFIAGLVLILWLLVCILLLAYLFIYFRASVFWIMGRLRRDLSQSRGNSKPAFNSRIWQAKRIRYGGNGGDRRNTFGAVLKSTAPLLVANTRAKRDILLKGYALLLLPLFVQFCLLFALSDLLIQAEQEVQRQVRSKAIISQANALSKLFYDAGVAMGGYSITKSPLFSDRYDKIVRQIPIDLSELSDLVGGNDKQQKIVVRLKTITSDGLKILGEAKSAIDDNRPDASTRCRPRSKYKQIRQLADQLQEELKGLTEDERRIENESPEQRNRSRTMVKVYMVGWLAFDVALVIALMTDFRRVVVRIMSRALFPRGKEATKIGKSFDSRPSSNKQAFGSKTWQAKRQRYGGKLAQTSQSAQNPQNSRGPRPRT